MADRGSTYGALAPSKERDGDFCEHIHNHLIQLLFPSAPLRLDPDLFLIIINTRRFILPYSQPYQGSLVWISFYLPGVLPIQRNGT